MTEKKDPGALAGALGADRNAAGQQPDLFTISPDTTPPAAVPAAEQSAHGVTPNGAVSTPDDRADDDAAAIARLAALPMLEYVRQRKAAAKELGCPAALLDRVVSAARSAARATDTGGAGRSLAFAETELWPEPVSGAELLNELVTAI